MDFTMPLDAPAREAENLRREATEHVNRAFQRVTWEWLLVHNLAIAAGLCESYQRGYMSCACGDLVDNAEWQPGCGRPL